MKIMGSKKTRRFKLTIIFLIGVFLITSGLGCKGTSKDLKEKIKPVNLVYWRTKDGQDAFSAILQGFQKLYPYISVTYRVIREEEYEQALLEAWAEDRGPDIFSIPNTWLGKYQSKILPLKIGEEISMAKRVVTGTVKKEEKIVEEKKKVPDLRQLRETFVETVPKDVVFNNQIYGLPLSLDILSLYYNRDFLNSAGIVTPPQTWEEFANVVKNLTLQDHYGEFIQSGAAMGTAENISYPTDILSLLMLQNGALMVGGNNRATFNQSLPGDSGYFPAQEALKFYLSFANPSSEIYTWNQDVSGDLDAFVAGRLGFMFGYSDYLAVIKQQAPKLNFDIAKAPQISGSLKEVNYARYPIETVSKKTKYPNQAWALVLYAAEAANAKTFIERTKYPTAHRDLISQQLQDFDLAPFVQGVLTAQTWYRGKNYSLVEESFKEMINDVMTGKKKIDEAINYATNKINLTY